MANLIQNTYHNSNLEGNHHLFFNGKPNSKYIPQLKLGGESSLLFNGKPNSKYIPQLKLGGESSPFF